MAIEQHDLHACVENPVISGFHPDPSVCRLGEDFFLVTSSFAYWHGIPLFHGADLTRWQQVGHVLSRPEQLDLHAPNLTYDGLWASTMATGSCS